MPPAIIAEENNDDGIVILEWSVRQEIEELIHDLRTQRGELSQRLDRIAETLKRHGERPFAHNNRYVPVSQALAEVMTELGIMQAFREQFNTIAERSLREAEDSQNPGAIRAVATYFPGTDAALAAWRRLADRAWDRGQLGLYASLANRSQEQSEPLRAKRLLAATSLLKPIDTTIIPADLEEINQMWGLTIPGFSSENTPVNRSSSRPISVSPFHNQNSKTTQPPVTFSQPDANGLVAMR